MSMANLMTNKNAIFNYDILEKFEAGLVLTGAEVKSVKNKNANLKGSYISFKNGEAYLVNAHISRYPPAGKQPHYEPARARKLLLTKKELKYLSGKTNEKGLTIIPLSVYTKRGFLKLIIGIARGKTGRDKRQVIKQRELARELRRATKAQY